MGCICSRGSKDEEDDDEEEDVKDKDKEKKSSEASVQLVPPTPTKKEENLGVVSRKDENTGSGPLEDGQKIPRLGTEAELIAAGWPPWLTSVAGEAIKGWIPRRGDSFEKYEKIGQGTYSSVYKARDLETGKIVAMKKVRFVNMDPESVRFMAREILLLRRLDHPNVMKLEGLVTSRVSGSLYLVFEYMDHDLTGLAATPGIKFTEPQVKCFMQQLLQGLEHCHSRGILHRDIKGSNLLIDNNGILKIADFGLATHFKPGQDQPLTSRVATLWYRAPELLLGATEYGVAIDMWSVGCILAELFAGKPIMPGRTEVEQMHKIFKLCGSPSEDYWEKTKLPLATSFKPQHPYKRCVAETFKTFPHSALTLIDTLLAIEPGKRGSASTALNSEFFTKAPFPCDPSSLPKHPPSKELDAKRRGEEARRQRADAVKGRGPESVRRGSRDLKGVPTPEFIPPGQANATVIRGYNGPVHTSRGAVHPTSVIHPNAYKTDLRKNPESSRVQNYSQKEQGFVQKKNRLHYSGPLMPPGGNMDDILKEHEKHIQEAVRKARLEKPGTKKNYDNENVYVYQL